MPNNAVPCPADGDASIPWWWDHLASQASALRQVGFTAIWLPPGLKAAQGVGLEADGYATFDDYDNGSRNQKGATPTRYGTREQLQRCVAQPGASIVTNKALAYAHILTSEGYPCVYYRDYSTDPDCYGLKPVIDNLIWIHETLADGPTLQRWKDFNVFAYKRLGGVHLLVGLNNDPNNSRTINVATGFGPSVGLHDYTGHAPDVVTDGNGNVTITIPQNANGLGYVSYSIQNQVAALPSHPYR